MNPSQIPPSPAPVAAPQPTLDINAVVLKYRQVRAKKEEIAERHKEELKPYNEALDKLEAAALQFLHSTGQQSANTMSGTCYINTRRSVTVEDAAAYRAWCLEHQRDDLMEVRAAKKAVEDYIEANATVPPGIKLSSDITVNFRK